MLHRILTRACFGIAKVAQARRWSHSPIYRTAATIGKRLLFKPPRELPPSALCVRLDGFRFALPRGSSFVYANRDFERGTKELLHRLLRPGDVCVDIGANIGFHTLHASRCVGSTGRVIAVEPSPANLAFLRANAALNRLENVQIVACAAGRQRRKRKLHLHPQGTLDSLYRPSRRGEDQVVEVEERSLDDLLMGSRVDLVKIDTEGAELDVLEGLELTVRANPRLHILVEWNRPCLRAAGREFEDLPRWLMEHGLEVLLIDEKDGSLSGVDSVLRQHDADALDAQWFANLWARPRMAADLPKAAAPGKHLRGRDA